MRAIQVSCWIIACASWTPMRAAISENLLTNPSFEKGFDGDGTPVGWHLYGRRDERRKIALVDAAQEGVKALLIEDDSDQGEIGVMQTIRAEPNLVYCASAWVAQAGTADGRGSYLQMRFLPSGVFRQRPLGLGTWKGFRQVSVTGTAPPDTKQITLYLYTHADARPRLVIDQVALVSGADPNDADDVPPPASPTYNKLAGLCLTTPLVREGRPEIAIVKPKSGVHDGPADRIEAIVRRITGTAVPFVEDEAIAATIRRMVSEGYPAKRLAGGKGPLPSHLICLGNRSTNQTLGALYDLYYCLTDLKYPGIGGYEVRTLHDPFGDGRNVIIVGASDAPGVEAATAAFLAKLERADRKQGSLQIDRLMEIKLGERTQVPTDIREVQTWDASDMYGSSGYFGWNTISKRMALYYMTGDTLHAREFLRLAFPDAAAKKEIAAVDGEMIENKDAPLSGPYHYNAHMMILFWDLIEESPVFTDDERLRVINAFSQQLQHRKGEGIYGTTSPPTLLGSRHGQWSAIALYCLGRYFQTHYPAPVWRHCVRSARTHFEALHESAWIVGELDNLYWYNTGIAPIFSYLALTGDRKPIDNGIVGQLLRGQEMLISGRIPDWALRGAALDFLHKAAYVTGDGRWIEYRGRTRNATDAFRLGQSFWPDDTLRPQKPQDLVGHWSVHPLPESAWRSRNSGISQDESFYFASFRSTPDARGDYILLDGFNGASRNPYHAFAILELRLAGRTILQGRSPDSQGYLNQVLTRCDGMVEPLVPMDAALRFRDVLGETAIAIGEVPKAAFCGWRRSIVQRIGRHTLVVDDLRFTADSRDMEVETLWEGQGLCWDDKTRALHVQTGLPTSRIADIIPCDPLPGKVQDGVASVVWSGAIGKGRHRLSLALIAPHSDDTSQGLECNRLADNAAVLSTPTRALAAVGQYLGVDGDIVVLGEDHLFGRNLRRAGPDEALVEANSPIDVDWDFKTGRLHVRTDADVKVRLVRKHREVLELRTGRHFIEHVVPDSAAIGALAERLGALAEKGGRTRNQALASKAEEPRTRVPAIEAAWTVRLPGGVVALEVGKADDREALYAAEGETIHVLGVDGKETRLLQADGPIRVMRWWPEPGLLLAGCTDEKVVAFDAVGRRRWTFVSEMDPAVFAAAKQYWFKSAHPGIHGLFTGVFLDGKSQAFVGSACTLEIVDESGRLVRRLPVFWGPGNVFQIVDAPDGSKNLLVGRRPNDSHALAIINNRRLSPASRGFDGVPAGHTSVAGWDGMSRHHLFHEDLDGDGKKEVVSEINGVWNRVTVWSAEGRALHNAQFGPGPNHRQADRTMRDLALVDLDGNGKKEILTATSRGLVVALDDCCNKVWSKRLPAPPVVLEPIVPTGTQTGQVVVGCEDGAVVVLADKGVVSGLGQVSGRPTGIARATNTDGTPTVVLATHTGHVVGFRLSR